MEMLLFSRLDEPLKMKERSLLTLFVTLLFCTMTASAQWMELNSGLVVMSQSSDPMVQTSGETLYGLCYNVVSTATVGAGSVDFSDINTATQCVDVHSSLLNTIEWSTAEFQTASLLRIRISSNEDLMALNDLVLPEHMAFIVVLFEIPVTEEQISNWSSIYASRLIYYYVSIPQ